jgi:3',5'-cyclic AMP phosphodiesterase CpdA
MRFIPGNHDIGDQPAAPGLSVSDPLDLSSLREYRRVFGSDWWSHRIGAWQLIGLNALLLASGTAEEKAQLAWLEASLRDGSGPLGVFLHKPFFRDCAEEGIAHCRYVPAAARRPLLDLLERRDLRFIASGHTHQVRRTMAAGVEHVWVPSTAFTLSDQRQELIGDKVVGVMMLELDGDQHAITHIVPAGVQAYDLDQFGHIYPELAQPR